MIQNRASTQISNRSNSFPFGHIAKQKGKKNYLPTTISEAA